MAVWTIGVPTEFRRTVTGAEPVQVIGPVPSAPPGDPPICPACGVRTKKDSKTGVALCQQRADKVCGPDSRTVKDNAAKQVSGDVPLTVGVDVIAADPGKALVVYLKG